ncbi:MAG: zinc-binding dehydrogenase [Candidatus Odinarchaeota archaeon]
MKKEEKTMDALTFEMKKLKLFKAYLRGKRDKSGFWRKGGPVGIKKIAIPTLPNENWIRVKTVYSGICGSDIKEITLSGALDNPLRTFISFPHIMGHESVGIVDKIGENISEFKEGDRVAISPWFSCEPRGIKPLCSRCLEGDYTHCKNFQRGILPPGMLLGTTKGYGGFAPYFTVHKSQCFKIPDNVNFEEAILADPFSVAFHSILILDPKPNSTILVYGLGIIGLLSIVCLKSLFNVENILAIGRYQFQKQIALKLGANHVFMSTGNQLVEEIGNYLNVELYTPERGYKWTMDGPNGIIDTIGSSETLEIGIRVITTQGKIVFLGVSTPRRWENTLHYFKELEIIGSNAFSIEIFEGKKAHAFEFFLKFLENKKISTVPLVTHKLPLELYQKAFDVLTKKRESKAIKVVFDFSF